MRGGRPSHKVASEATITGTNGSDNLNGTNLADSLVGLAGDDTLIGFDGDDVLEGGKGADQLFGSSGLDYASYRGSDQGVFVKLDEAMAGSGDAQGDQRYSIQGPIGSGRGDVFWGDDQGNVLHGEEGADQLAGRAGDDKLYGGDGNDVLAGGPGDDELRGGPGTDTANLFDDAGVVADLASGTATGALAGNDRLFGIENLIGTLQGDRLAGNDGPNVLIGHRAVDLLTGRGGADRFDFDLPEYSSRAAPDHILDFSRAQGDRIDLSGIDANEQVDGNQAFKFIGQAPFTGVAQLRFYQAGGRTYIEANTTDVTPFAEVVVILDSLIRVQAGDFLL